MKKSRIANIERLRRKPGLERPMSEMFDTSEGRMLGICEELNAKKDTDSGRIFGNFFEELKQAGTLDEMILRNTVIGAELNWSIDRPVLRASKRSRLGTYLVDPKYPANPNDPQAWAVYMFARLVTNKLCNDFAGPCERCGNYYLKKRSDQNTYCSKSCGNKASARTWNDNQLKKEFKKKAEAWKMLRKRYLSERPEEPLKTWMEHQPEWEGENLTWHWVTRAVNKTKNKAPRYGIKIVLPKPVRPPNRSALRH